jgi:hypothetical protein
MNVPAPGRQCLQGDDDARLVIVSGGGGRGGTVSRDGRAVKRRPRGLTSTDAGLRGSPSRRA